MFETKLSKLKVVEPWKLNLESCLKVAKYWSCWILKVESWKLSNVINVEVVESSKLNVESCRMLKVESCQSWKCWILKVC